MTSAEKLARQLYRDDLSRADDVPVDRDEFAAAWEASQK